MSFCKRNKIESYDALVAYCATKRMIPVAEEVWAEHCVYNLPTPVEHSTLQEVVAVEKIAVKKTIVKAPARKETKSTETNEAEPKTKAPRRRRRSSQKSKK